MTHIGKTVRVRFNRKYPEPYALEVGKIVARVKDKGYVEYIVQFKDKWCYFKLKELKVMRKG